MIRFTDKYGNQTKWLSSKPTTKELEKLTIDQLFIIAKKKKNFKKLLLEFLHGVEL